MRIIHAEDMKIIIGDLRYELVELDIIVGLQRAQHHKILKGGYIYEMMDKIKLMHRLTKLLFKVLKLKPLISLKNQN